MSEMKSLLHIGMPKCMSTSIQSYLREAKNVFFAGIGPSKFVAPDMLQAFQRQVMRTSTQFYDRDFVARVFDYSIMQAKQKGARVFALSDESIPFAMTYGLVDVSYSERLQRLKEVLPEPVTVLMLTRRPADYLKSVYKYETVMHGLSFTYNEFLKRLLLKGDTYFLSTVKYFHFAEEARRVFSNVRVIAMEDIKADKRALPSFFEELGLSMTAAPPRQNVGMADEKFENFRNLYAPYGDTLAINDLNYISPADRLLAQETLAYYGSIIASIMAKDQALTTLRNLAVQLPDKPPAPSFEMGDKTRALLKEYVAASNAKLKAQYGVDTVAHGYDEF
ncbi:MAG TPA: hypothetical protein VH000_04430 [Rhizomicrobium sp.]|jgi:hypothetical protein|nr:hypothetical protein [Rhizomicrobium sp.]HEX4533457.1 hypothetical protein [Rhizomicrobium sp.]